MPNIYVWILRPVFSVQEEIVFSSVASIFAMIVIIYYVEVVKYYDYL